jgi:hypothetical protein
MEKGVYFIENTIDERSTAISGYFSTEEEAREALKECCNWFGQKGSGTIYYQEFGLGGKQIKIYEKPC